mgnify:CR=1 FL=1
MEQEEKGAAPDARSETGGEHSADSNGTSDDASRIETPGPGDTAPEEHVQKRTKRESRKELLEHLQKKNAQLMDLDKEVKNVTEQLKNKEDRLLRLAADFENYRKRTHREWELLQKRANADLIREFMVGIDNLDRAFAALGDADESLREGLRLIHSGFMDILGKAGVVEMDVAGTKFDPRYHEAVGEIESERVESGHIAEVVQKGYMLHDEVLRPARVMVSKKP